MKYTKKYSSSDNTERKTILTVTEVANYLKLSTNYDSAFLTDLVISVEEIAEKFINTTIIPKEIEEIIDNIESNDIELAYTPVIKVKEVASIDQNGNKVSLQKINYHFDSVTNSVRLKVDLDLSKVSILYIAGHTKSTIPRALKIGMLLHIESVYDNGKLDIIPQSALSFYSLYRKLKI